MRANISRAAPYSWNLEKNTKITAGRLLTDLVHSFLPYLLNFTIFYISVFILLRFYNEWSQLHMYILNVLQPFSMMKRLNLSLALRKTQDFVYVKRLLVHVDYPTCEIIIGVTDIPDNASHVEGKPRSDNLPILSPVSWLVDDIYFMVRYWHLCGHIIY